MARFFLVGGAGFIGAHLARRLLDAGDEVVVFDAGVDYARSPPALTRTLLDWRRRVLLADAEVVAGDAGDPGLRDVLARCCPDHVVHLGNLPLADLAAADPGVARVSIVDATANVLAAAAAQPQRPSLTYVSSSMVYGDFACDPIGEAGPLRPRSAYGRLKLHAERRLSTVARHAGVPLTIVRPSAVYGPGDVHGRVLARLVEAATDGVPFVLTASPHTRIDFTWVQDAAAGIHAAALRASGPPRAYNVTAGRARTLAEAIEVVRAHVPELDVVAGGHDAVAPRRGSLDVGRARRELGWASLWRLEDGLAAYLEFARGAAPARGGVTSLPFFGAEREWAAHGAQLRPAVEAALTSGRWLQGEPVADFERALAARCGRAHAVAVGSGTDALFFALRALGIGRGDEVVVPDLSFVATAAAIVRAGARPVWADVDEHGLLDRDAAAAAIGPATAGVVAVSLYGRPLEAEAFEALAARHGLALVEDAAQALGASRAARPAGAVGLAGCLSFDPTKPVAAPGSGGAVVTDDDVLAATCRALRLHGRDGDGAFSQLGYNSQLPTLAAAVLQVKLGLEPAWRARRRAIAAAYGAALADIDGLGLPSDPPGGEHAYSKYVIRRADRDRLRAALADEGVPALVHYPRPLREHPLFAAYPGGEAPRARALSRTVLSLPIHPHLDDAEVRRVADAVATASSTATRS